MPASAAPDDQRVLEVLKSAAGLLAGPLQRALEKIRRQLARVDQAHGPVDEAVLFGRGGVQGRRIWSASSGSAMATRAKNVASKANITHRLRNFRAIASFSGQGGVRRFLGNRPLQRRVFRDWRDACSQNVPESQDQYAKIALLTISADGYSDKWRARGRARPLYACPVIPPLRLPMPPQVIEVRDAEDWRDVVHQTVQALTEGKLVAFPTETVYGIGRQRAGRRGGRAADRGEGSPAGTSADVGRQERRTRPAISSPT